jgi:hypothetical protein
MKKLIPLLLIAVIFGSCAKKVAFNPSTTVPGATGGVKIKKDQNDNYAIQLHVRNLPEADDLQPPKRSYTVWMETVDNRALNVGGLEISKGLFSRKRKGSMETTSSFRPVRIFVTPEDEQAPSVPSTTPVLSTKLFKMK